MKNTFIGTPMERREDLRFLRGRGIYVDDLAVPGLLYAVILRSSVAHGRIRKIDASAALKIEGVHSVITAKDMIAKDVAGGVPIIPMRLQPLPQFKPFEQPVIAHDKVRYVGEPIAVVLATSVAEGEDALDAITLEVAELPAVADWTVAARNKSILFETPGTNRSLVFHARALANAASASPLRAWNMSERLVPCVSNSTLLLAEAVCQSATGGKSSISTSMTSRASSPTATDAASTTAIGSPT